MSNNKMLVGLLIGTLCALMFAPQKGKILRENMEERGLEPLMKGFVALFNEVIKEVEKKAGEYMVEEENPFTIREVGKNLKKRSVM